MDCRCDCVQCSWNPFQTNGLWLAWMQAKKIFCQLSSVCDLKYGFEQNLYSIINHKSCLAWYFMLRALWNISRNCWQMKMDINILHMFIYRSINFVPRASYWWSGPSLGGSVGCVSNWWSGGCIFEPHWVGNILSWRFNHEIFSTVYFFFLLIQEGQLSVSGIRICTILVNELED